MAKKSDLLQHLPHGSFIGIPVGMFNEVTAPRLTETLTTVRYGAVYNSALNTPSGIADGAATPWGRVFAEILNLTVTDPTSVAGIAVSLISSTNGYRALVDVLQIANGPLPVIATGSVRWWTMNAETGLWHLTAVEDILPTGVQRVSTPDQFNTVGAK